MGAMIAAGWWLALSLVVSRSAQVGAPAQAPAVGLVAAGEELRFQVRRTQSEGADAEMRATWDLRGVLRSGGVQAMPVIRGLLDEPELSPRLRAALAEDLVAVTPGERVGDLLAWLGDPGASRWQAPLRAALIARARANADEHAAVSAALDEAIRASAGPRAAALVELRARLGAGPGSPSRPYPPRPMPPPPRRGEVLIATGGTLTGVGLILVGAGIGSLASASRHEAMQGPDAGHGFPGSPGELAGAIVVPVGAVLAAVGIPLLAVGVHRQRAWRSWKRGVVTRLRPDLGRVAHGAWIPGLALRF